MERPALRQLLEDVKAGKIDIIVVYKVDRLTRSLADFAKIVEILDAQSASFVSVTHSSAISRLPMRLWKRGARKACLKFAQYCGFAASYRSGPER